MEINDIHTHTHIQANTQTYIYMYIYICVYIFSFNNINLFICNHMSKFKDTVFSEKAQAHKYKHTSYDLP